MTIHERQGARYNDLLLPSMGAKISGTRRIPVIYKGHRSPGWTTCGGFGSCCYILSFV